MSVTSGSGPNPIVAVAAPGGRTARFGNDAPASFILGPCALESREHALAMATKIRDLADRAGVDVVYKTSFDKANRTSAAGYRGAGLDAALAIFAEIRETVGLPLLTDVHLPEHCAPVAEVADILQIPAFLCRQTDLLEAAAKTGRAINVKKGQFLAPWDMKNVVDKLVAFGARDIILTERGASFGYNMLVSDMRALPEMKATGCPVVFDATHSVQEPGGRGASSGGRRELAPMLARAAVAVGVAGVFMETHETPDAAPSDGPNMIPFADMEGVLRTLTAFDRLRKGMTLPL